MRVRIPLRIVLLEMTSRKNNPFREGATQASTERLERVASAREATSSQGGWGFPREGTGGDRGKKVFLKGEAGFTGALPAGAIN